MPGAERTDPNYRDVDPRGPAAPGARPPQPGPARRGAGRRLPQADARRRAVAGRAQPRRAPDAGRRRHGRVPPPGRLDRRRAGAGDRLRRARTTTTGWRSTSSPWPRDKHTRRPDVVLFVNGLPLAVIELKNPADENATVWTRLPAAPDLPGADPGALRHQRGAGRLRRRAGAHRRARRRARSGSSPGARSAGARMRRAQHARAAGGARRACSRSAASSTCCATSSCSRTTAAGSSSRRWPATTSSMR